MAVRLSQSAQCTEGNNAIPEKPGIEAKDFMSEKEPERQIEVEF
jgi:hypothetical protein